MTKKQKPAKKAAIKTTLKNKLLFGSRFIPALILFLLAFSTYPKSTAIQKPTAQVLSYATAISQSDLLAQTNIQRANNGVSNLSLNSQLNSAAQTKALDMVARNYWSHVTPEGKQPWDFITDTGYQYLTAGENLAYGFATSSDAVTGWMNSPPHRENLLNSNFKEVGFGFANSDNFVGDGQQTVVVAMYASPQQVRAASPTTVITRPTYGGSKAEQTQNIPTVSSEPIQTTQTNLSEQVARVVQPKTLTTSNPIAPSIKEQPLSAKPATVSKIQILTGGNAQWSRGLLIASIISVALFWALEKGLHLKRLFLASEQYFASHLHIDLTIFGFIMLGWALLQATGSVR